MFAQLGHAALHKCEALFFPNWCSARHTLPRPPPSTRPHFSFQASSVNEEFRCSSLFRTKSLDLFSFCTRLCEFLVKLNRGADGPGPTRKVDVLVRGAVVVVSAQLPPFTVEQGRHHIGKVHGEQARESGREDHRGLEQTLGTPRKAVDKRGRVCQGGPSR